MDVLRMRSVTMGFGPRPVLRHLNLSLRAGEVVGLSGSNGVGKSTLLRLAAGLLLPHSGELEVLGTLPARARRQGRIGWATSGEASFTRRLSLRANLQVTARISGVRHVAQRIDELAETLGFAGQLETPAGRCSSGIRQRAALARALLHRPPLLLLDEPLRGVDAASSLSLAQTLRRSWRRETVLWVSHSREELALVADRVLHLEDGCLQPRGASASAA